MKSHFTVKHYLLAILGLGVLVFLWVPPIYKLSFEKITVQQIVGDQVIEKEVGPGSQDWVDLDLVAKSLPRAIVAAEDAKFYQHQGIDIEQIEYALRDSIKAGRFVRGASTLSQQLVKMAFLSRERSLLRKLREVTGALLLEAFYSKEDILVWYINLVEFGHDLYGVKAASTRYFGVSPKNLATWQSVLLASVLPSPVKWSSSLKKKNLSHFMKRRFELVLTRMRILGWLGEESWRQAMNQGNYGSPVRFLAPDQGQPLLTDEDLSNFLRENLADQEEAANQPAPLSAAEVDRILSPPVEEGAQELGLPVSAADIETQETVESLPEAPYPEEAQTDGQSSDEPKAEDQSVDDSEAVNLGPEELPPATIQDGDLSDDRASY